MRADQAPNLDHCEFIYHRHRLAERLSVAALEDDGSLLAVHLYHHERQGACGRLGLHFRSELFARFGPRR